MNDNAFIFMLVLGMTVLAGILTVTHVSAYRLKQRLRLRREAPPLAPDLGAIMEPELDFASTWYGTNEGNVVSVQVKHAETAR